jgi:dTDP-N-acetylfucosamine:lipid II N-acetylfucosaminyltransferase
MIAWGRRGLVKKKVVHHACFVPMFTPHQIAFLISRFPQLEQSFYVQGAPAAYLAGAPQNVRAVTAPDAPDFISAASAADRVVLHGIIDDRTPIRLSRFPDIMRKTIWMLWGGDLHWHEYREPGVKREVERAFRAQLIGELYGIATPVAGDYALVKAWYPTRARHIDSPVVVFPFERSDLDRLRAPARPPVSTSIQVGNSGNPSNEHLEVLDWLARLERADLRIYCPLSYGNADYIRRVIQRGTELFGDRFVPLTELLPAEEYNRHLAGLDALILNHRRQQAFGNALIALYLGVKVFLRSDVTTWQYLSEKLGCRIFDTTRLSGSPEEILGPIDEATRACNRASVGKLFDQDWHASMWQRVFDA